MQPRLTGKDLQALGAFWGSLLLLMLVTVALAHC